MVSEVVFIGGRAGAGKTSVGLAIHTALSGAGVPHCLLEGDYLDMAYPPPREQRLAERNLAAVWANFRALGHSRLVYTNTVSVLPDEVAALSAAMGDAPRAVPVLLTCTDETAHQRLRRRESGAELQRHLESSARMAAALDRGVEPRTHRITTDDRSIAEVAADVITHTGWLH